MILRSWFALVLIVAMVPGLTPAIHADDAGPKAPAARQAAEAEIRQLVDVLGSQASTYEKTIACKRLARIGTAGSVAAIKPLLLHEDLNVAARIALQAIPDPAAGAALIAAMDEVKGPLLVGIINSLGARREAAAVKPLSDKLADGDATVAQAAALALGRIASDDAQAALEAALPRAKGPLAAAVGDGLLRCGEALVARGQGDAALQAYARLQKADMPEAVRVAVARATTVLRAKEGVAAVNERLSDPDPELFAVALDTSAVLTSAEMTRALVEAMPKLPAARRVLVLSALRARGDRSALPAIIDAAKSGDSAVSAAALRALSTVGDGSVIPLLLDGLNSGDSQRVAAAHEAMCAIESPSVDRAVADALKKADDKSLRSLLELAGERRLAEAMPMMIRALDDSQPATRLAAVKALGQTVGADDLAVLVNRLAKPRDAEELAALKASLRTAFDRLVDKEACAKSLAAVMKDAKPELHCFAIELMGISGGPSAVAFVAAATLHADETVRDTASRVLGEWPNPEAGPTLLQLAKTSPTSKFRIRALRGYLRIIRQFDSVNVRRLDMVQEAMNAAERNEERILAVESIGRIQSPDALKTALGYLDKPVYRETACAAAVQISEELTPSDPDLVVSAMQKVLPLIENKKVALRAEAALQEARKRLNDKE